MKNVVRILLIVIVALVAFIWSRPGHYHVERSVTVPAPAEAVYATLADFHQFNQWSPWSKLDPAMTTSYEGPESGVGAAYHWAGNDKVGEGSMKIIEATPPSRIGMQLEFLKPFKDTSRTAFTLAPDGDGTKVTWAMDGDMNFISKAMCLMKPMDAMIGPDFEKGLATLSTVVASAAAAGGAPADSSAPAAPTGLTAK